MNARDRFLATMRFEPVDRPFRWETLGMWPETLDRWYAEGLDPSFKQPWPGDRGAMIHDEYQRVLVHGFGLDRVDYLRHAVISGYTDSPFCPAFEREVLSEDEDTRTILDVDGIVKREIKGYSTSSMPQFVRHPVQTRGDCRQLLDRLDPDHPNRLSADWADQCALYRDRDFPIGLTVCGAFGHPRNLFGLEGLCVAYHEQPALVHEIMEHWADFYIRLASRVWADIQYDFILIWEDMAYKNGPLISPRFVREFMLPYYRRLIEHVRGLGCPCIMVDSDGDVTELAPLFISAGVNAMFPFEVQSGMDVRLFRRQYGKALAIIGGLDKRVLAEGRAAIDHELQARMRPMLDAGGYIPCLDHTAPPNVSLHNFRYFIERARTLAAGLMDGEWHE
jgi:uroporphyrinogen decarboxylase